MTADKIITIWHYLPDTERYIKAYYYASCHEVKKVTGTKTGMTTDNAVKIRIPVMRSITVSTGDYLRIGKVADAEPKRGADYKITEISENFKGTNPHIRITAQ